jgi:hypothetical protein
MRNDTANGNDYEDKVFTLVQRIIATRRCRIIPMPASFHWRQNYYSLDRQAHIEFEKLVELFAKGVDRWIVAS